MTTLTSFSLFPLLPTEIRLKIYSLALLLPRTLSISCTRQSIKRHHHYAEKFHSVTPPPALLHVSQESRYEALSYYTLTFKTEFAANRLYISWEMDTIHCSDIVLPYLLPYCSDTLTRLIVEVSDPAYFGHFHIETVRSMKKLQVLELRIQELETSGYNKGGKFSKVVEKDFKQEKMKYLGWEAPEVVFVCKDTGKYLETMEGGALVPGWVEGVDGDEVLGEHDF